jgi:DNA-binding transcriptional MerR regulator
MLKIGDFSRLTQIPIKTLRYYDEMGLLKPAEVDQFTGYRYYTLDQLPRLNRIIALKDSGFSLDQITQLLTSHLTATELRDLLRLKHLELQQQVEAARARLTRLEIRLKQIEMEDNMPNHEIITKKLEPQRVLAIRQLIPTLPDRAALFDEINTALRQHRLKPTAPHLLIYHHAGYRDTDLDLEIAIPIDSSAPDSLPLSATRQLTARTIPAINTALTCLLRGSYDQLNGVYTALNTYLHTHGHNYLGPAREVYLRTDAASPADYLTEVQYPIGEFTGETIVDGLKLPATWDDTNVQLPLSRRARTALEFASAEAIALQQPEITPTHVLLGLLRDTDGFAAQVLIRLGLTIDPLRAACPHSDSSTTAPTITAAARQIVTLAHTEAHQLGHDYIGTEHLLLALAHQHDPAVMRLLTARNITADHIRTIILQPLNH